MKTIKVIIALFLIAGPVSGQSLENGATDTITKVGTTSAQFLKIGVGARAIALGGTFVAEASDLSALYWNPAGLSQLQGGAVDLSHTQYIADINYSYAAFGLNLGNVGSVAASLIFLDSGDMDVRTTSRPEGTGELFKVQNFALQVSYAKALTDNFSIGTTVKYINEKIWHSAASATAFDIGVLFTTPFRKLRLGANMANFGPKMQMTGRDILFSQDPGQNQEGNVEIVNAEFLMEEHPLPLMFKVGLAWDAMTTGDHRVIVLTDATHPNDNSEYLNFGTEYNFRDLLALRVGYKNVFEEDGEQGITFGGGLNLRVDRSVRVKIDYAYADFGRLEQAHWYSFSIQF